MQKENVKYVASVHSKATNNTTRSQVGQNVAITLAKLDLDLYCLQFCFSIWKVNGKLHKKA